MVCAVVPDTTAWGTAWGTEDYCGMEASKQVEAGKQAGKLEMMPKVSVESQQLIALLHSIQVKYENVFQRVFASWKLRARAPAGNGSRLVGVS